MCKFPDYLTHIPKEQLRVLLKCIGCQRIGSVRELTDDRLGWKTGVTHGVVWQQRGEVTMAAINDSVINVVLIYTFNHVSSRLRISPVFESTSL